tara:strand:- start:1065 stop:1469 length:405 start_codon:yes stop_codon:yes gene_type:complete
MGTSDKAAAKRKWRNANLFDTQSLESGEGAANVDNGIDPTYLVKVDLIDGRIVNCSFCLADPGKDTSSGFLDLRGQGAVLNDLYNIGEVTLGGIVMHMDVDLDCAEGILGDAIDMQVKVFQVKLGELGLQFVSR